MAMSKSKKRSRAISGGKAAAMTNRWFALRKVVGHTDGLEVLECGHSQRPRSDMIGEYDAMRRRCKNCPKPVVTCDSCVGSGVTYAGGTGVAYRCPACNGHGKWLAKG